MEVVREVVVVRLRISRGLKLCAWSILRFQTGPWIGSLPRCPTRVDLARELTWLSAMYTSVFVAPSTTTGLTSRPESPT